MKTIKQVIFVFLLFSVSVTVFAQSNLDILILNGKYEEALSEIAKQTEINPSAKLFFKKGLIYNNLQNYQEAELAFLEALKYQPDNADVMVEVADCQTLLGNISQAARYYEKAVQLQPGNLTTAAKMGKNHISQKNYTEGYKVFSEIYQLDSTNLFWNKQLAFCSFRIGNRIRAISLYENIVERNPGDLGSVVNLIHCYDWRKEPEKIVELIDSSLVIFPENDELLFEKAKFYFRNRMYEQAEEAYQRYFEAGGDSDYDITLNYGISTYFAKHIENALEVFNNLNRANPNDPVVMYYQGLCHRKLNNFEEAEKYLEWAIEGSTPYYVADMYHILGQVYGQQRKFEESINAFVKANQMNPENKEVLFEIATTYEEFNSNKTLALNYYRIYLKEVGESGENVDYALSRITKLKEDIFMNE